MPPYSASQHYLIPPNADSATMHVYCFPYAGGGTWLFRTWPNQLAADIAVYPIKLPGRADRIREAAVTDMHALADTLSEQLAHNLRRPYVLFGCSMGAILAYECALRLSEHGAPDPALLIAATAPAPSMLHVANPIHKLPDGPFLRSLQARFDNPMLASLNQEILPLVLPSLRGDITMYETYQSNRENATLNCPIYAIGGLQDNITETEIRAWAHHTTGPFTVDMIPGGHFVIHNNEALFMNLLQTKLQQHKPF
jgi:medium-chain acyl-[acyl-carrier-protein] hydrolase